MFNPGLEIGQILKNADIVEKFKCGNMGSMRRSKTTNTLVIVSDYTKGIYHDKWIGGVLHYTGMGKSGDQDIRWSQNATLADSDFNGVDVHLFEVIDAGEYIYCGRIELVDKPYTDMQPGEDGNDRKVGMFPIRPVPDNDVKKPPMFVFKDIEDYKSRGKNVDSEYAKFLEENKKKKVKNSSAVIPVQVSKPEPKKIVNAPDDIEAKTVNHKKYGVGLIKKVEGPNIVITFKSVGEKTLNYEVCMKNKLLEIL